MKSKSAFIIHGLSALAVAGVLSLASVSAFSQPETDGDAPVQHERMRKHLGDRLDKMSTRLNITPAQQAAWAQYRNAVEGQFGHPPTRPAADADAATLARWRAERASDLAKKLAVVADATATLQSALDAEQRKTLSQMVRHEGRGDRHHKRHGDARPTAAM